MAGGDSWRDIAAIVLTAGRSTRQDGFKPLLPIGEDTVLGRCLGLFAQKGLFDIVAVLGHRAGELAPVVKSGRARAVLNPDYDQGMLSSVKTGVQALSSKTRAFFVLPVDIPLVRPLTLDILLQTLRDEPQAQVLVPTFTRITGHPPLISSELIQEIIAYQGSQGLRGVLDQAEQIQVPVPDKHILLDLDCPEQYQKALELRQTYDLPDPDEAYALLAWQQGDGRAVIGHSHKVAQTAERIAKEVNHFSGAGLDIGLVKSAALLHDIAKGRTDHARAGGKLLMELGFSSRLAEIVARHADCSPSAQAPVDETEVVYLADKLVQGDRLVGLEKRFARKYEQFYGNSEARQAVKRRWEQAGYVLARVEQGLGKKLEEWLQF